MIKRCANKARFDTYEHAKDYANPTMTVMFCNVCGGYHHTHRRQDNYLGMTATPDEVLERFR